MSGDRGRAGELIGWARLAVGVGMLVAPRQVMELGSGTPTSGDAAFLARTIGVRDLVLGLGTILATRSRRPADAQRWLAIGLCSDLIDVGVGGASEHFLGRRGAVIASLAPVPFVAGDILALAAVRRDRDFARE